MKPLILLLTLASLAVNAEEWVSVGAAKTVAPAANATDRSTQAQPSRAVSGNASLINELSVQVRQLQEEVSMLRGLIEQQDYKIEQSQQDQQQRYLDVDRRLSALHSQSTQAPAAAPSAAPQADTANRAYQQAMDLVKAKEYDQAQAAFGAFIKAYPEDKLFGNALYWSAEIWLVQGEPSKAITQFKRVVNEQSKHNKAADAMYKLGVTYDREGKPTEAKQWLQRVVKEYQGKADTTVRLAQSYLDKI